MKSFDEIKAKIENEDEEKGITTQTKSLSINIYPLSKREGIY